MAYCFIRSSPSFLILPHPFLLQFRFWHWTFMKLMMDIQQTGLGSTVNQNNVCHNWDSNFSRQFYCSGCLRKESYVIVEVSVELPFIGYAMHYCNGAWTLFSYLYMVFTMHSYTNLKSDCHPNSMKGFIIILDDKVETLGKYVIFMQLVIKMETSNCRKYVWGKSCI
jgi:hypothetical protein